MNYDLTSNLPTPVKQDTCPNCGYCPHCGRKNYQTYPFYPQPQPYPFPFWPYAGDASQLVGMITTNTSGAIATTGNCATS